MQLLVFISMLKALHFLIDASYDSLYIEYDSDYVITEIFLIQSPVCLKH